MDILYKTILGNHPLSSALQTRLIRPQGRYHVGGAKVWQLQSNRRLMNDLPDMQSRRAFADASAAAMGDHAGESLNDRGPRLSTTPL